MTEDRSQGPRRAGKSRFKLDEEYKVLGLLGMGGMAEVYKAEQSSLGRIVAVKKLKGPLAQNPEMLERFCREARSAANLQHENIVQVYQMGEVDGERYIVMEYVEGRDLKSIVKTAGALPWNIASLILRQIALGLGFAHQRGYIHRDIKPGNIMVSHRGEVKIMDFGIVRRVDSELTQTGAFLGTPSYMSPEQLRGQNVTPLSDLFSLGVLFYEILAGDKPFKAESEASLVYKIMSEKERPIRKLSPEVPRRIARVVKRLLKKNPAKRFESAPELAGTLERMLGENYVAQAGREIASFMMGLESLPEPDKTRKTAEIDSEPAQARQKKTRARAEPKSRAGKSKARASEDESESRWMVQTLVLMAVTLGLILIAYFMQSQGWLKYLLEPGKLFH